MWAGIVFCKVLLLFQVRENREKSTYKDFQTVFNKCTPIPSHQKFVFSASSEESAFFLDVLELEDKSEEEISNGQENMDKVLASVSKVCSFTKLKNCLPEKLVFYFFTRVER